MVFLWKDLAYKIELVNLRQKNCMRSTPEGSALKSLWSSLSHSNSQLNFSSPKTSFHLFSVSPKFCKPGNATVIVLSALEPSAQINGQLEWQDSLFSLSLFNICGCKIKSAEQECSLIFIGVITQLKWSLMVKRLTLWPLTAVTLGTST